MRVSVLALLVMTAACAGRSTAQLKPVSLPDISAITQVTAREQLRDAYATLDAKIRNRDTPPLELANRYGEMGRLLLRSAKDIQQDRIATARDAARRWNAHVILKGSHTIIAAPEGATFSEAVDAWLAWGREKGYLPQSVTRT